MPADKKVTKLTKVYKDRRTWMEEFVDFVDNYKDSEQRVELQSQLKALEGAKDAYEEARENLLIEDEEADEVQMRSDRRDFFKKFHRVRGFIMDMLKTDESVQPIASSTMANTTTASVKMRLPKLELPTFDGNITQWVTYKDRFVSLVHDVAELPDVAKLQYLLASLKGEAALQFEHVPLEEKSYASTWDTLLQRYDDNKQLRREYFKALVQLEPMSAATSSELTRIVNETRRLVQGMKRLEEPTQHWNTPLTTLVMYKFDNTTLIAYEHFAVENKTDTYDLLMEFCEKRIRILNSTALHSIGVIGTRSATKAYQRNRLPDQKINRLPHSYAVTCAAQSSYNDKRVCPACKANHLLLECTTFEAA
ncbi:uncharacterized protein LOC133393624 isoform X2 [Anopheles gambiae]|uniref:uncharacterized protein LOC133393624 isoform X2 n=1 Tax=Anopheles gambiae TaxID=7165 RepID=UPI002AC8BF71|nr:uncharacterized protein LOC133393624 isoform X2 [Anopheles gambiae]